MLTGRLVHKQGGGRTSILLAMLGFTTLSFLPDADVIAFALRIPYEDPFGHRGASHSFAFAGLCALAVWGLGRNRMENPGRAGLATFLVVASHGILDAFTDGGLGIALLWPITAARYFAPWRPIPVAPIGLGMLSGRGTTVLLTEIAIFAPVMLAALWPLRKKTP